MQAILNKEITKIVVTYVKYQYVFPMGGFKYYQLPRRGGGPKTKTVTNIMRTFDRC